jgi:hypothetical protein
MLLNKGATMQEYAAQYCKGLSQDAIYRLFSDYDVLVERFETEFADLLKGCDSDNMGGVIVYYRANKKVGFFDYLNAVGSIYELGNKHIDEFPEEWAERVGVELPANYRTL